MPESESAADVAAGCIALWKAANPSLTPEDVGMIIHQTARDRGVVPGKENDWGAGIIDALAGLKRALSVHRVNGQSVWELEHRVGEQIELRLDGVPSTMGAIAVGFERKTVDFGAIQVGIGSTVLTVWLGLIDAAGEFVTMPHGYRDPWTLDAVDEVVVGQLDVLASVSQNDVDDLCLLKAAQQRPE